MKSLHTFGIYHNNIKRALFDNFLLQPGHEHFLQDFLIFCSIHDINRITHVIKAFEFTLNGGYTYAKLFQLNNQWADFFKENAWPCGIRKYNDNRLGVNAESANNVMRYYTGGNLDNAILKAYKP